MPFVICFLMFWSFWVRAESLSDPVTRADLAFTIFENRLDVLALKAMRENRYFSPLVRKVHRRGMKQFVRLVSLEEGGYVAEFWIYRLPLINTFDKNDCLKLKESLNRLVVEDGFPEFTTRTKKLQEAFRAEILANMRALVHVQNRKGEELCKQEWAIYEDEKSDYTHSANVGDETAKL